MKNPKDKGMVDGGGLAISIATTAIVLIVSVLVITQVVSVGDTAVATSTTARVAEGNISNYIWTGVTLVSIGLVLVAGMGLVYYMMRR